MIRVRVVVLRANGQGLEIEFIRVAYDVEKTAQAIEATAMPDQFAAMLRGGTG